MVLLLPIICSCSMAHFTSHDEVKRDESTSFKYLTYSIYKDSINHTTHVQLINQTEIAGQVKTPFQAFTSQNYLQCNFVDKNNKIISTQTLNHPLYYRAEVLNENQEFQTSTIVLNQAEFILRFNQSTSLNKLVITEYLQAKTPKIIYESNL